VVQAVARGGIITFNCGPEPVTITMTATAKIVHGHRIVIDGGGKVTLSGGGKIRILSMNTCHDCWEQTGRQLKHPQWWGLLKGGVPLKAWTL